jgi:hypothetical protein
MFAASNGTIRSRILVGEGYPASLPRYQSQRFKNEHSTDLAMGEMDAMDAVDEKAV